MEQRTDYKNWIPRGLIASMCAGTAVLTAGAMVLGTMGAAELRRQGYERVERIDTTNGLFMTAKEAKWLGLRGSTLLTGKK